MYHLSVPWPTKNNSIYNHRKI